MSDFEINLKIATILSNESKGGLVCEDQAASLKAKSSSVLVHDIVNQWEVNYCNSWSDMGPLIDKANISLLQQGDKEGCCAFMWDKEDAECWHENPLRAAAIVYLMIKENQC